MVSRLSFLKGWLPGFALSLLGAVLVVVALWTLPETWLADSPVMLRLAGCIALLYLPGLFRVIHLWRTSRHGLAWATLGGCTIGTVLLALLGALLVAIAVGESLPRHD
ncbi:hypothetical protein DYST_02643 [Dyella terrae]|nr:hypothetical protein DYST_02643 [Dyella terrae]